MNSLSIRQWKQKTKRMARGIFIKSVKLPYGYWLLYGYWASSFKPDTIGYAASGKSRSAFALGRAAETNQDLVYSLALKKRKVLTPPKAPTADTPTTGNAKRRINLIWGFALLNNRLSDGYVSSLHQTAGTATLTPSSLAADSPTDSQHPILRQGQSLYLSRIEKDRYSPLARDIEYPLDSSSFRARSAATVATSWKAWLLKARIEGRGLQGPSYIFPWEVPQ